MKKNFLAAIAFAISLSSVFAQGDWQTNLTYNMAIPMGKTADFIGESSFRGVMIECDYFIEDEWSVGFIGGIQTFYQVKNQQTYTEGTLTATGSQFNYLNSIPLLLSGKYHFDRYAPITPHIGLGFGLYNMIQTVEFSGIFVENNNWQFGIMPEAGIGIEMSPSTDFILNVQYANYFKSKDIDTQNYLSINVGFRFIP